MEGKKKLMINLLLPLNFMVQLSKLKSIDLVNVREKQKLWIRAKILEILYRKK